MFQYYCCCFATFSTNLTTTVTCSTPQQQSTIIILFRAFLTILFFSWQELSSPQHTEKSKLRHKKKILFSKRDVVHRFTLSIPDSHASYLIVLAAVSHISLMLPKGGRPHDIYLYSQSFFMSPTTTEVRQKQRFYTYSRPEGFQLPPFDFHVMTSTSETQCRYGVGLSHK